MEAEDSEGDMAEDYLRKVIAQTKQNNNQLCMTGNAFNKLFEGKVG